MRQLIIDRFEGKYAICEDEEKRAFAIELSELPEKVKAGAVIEISDDGELRYNEEETLKRKERIKNKQNRLFK